IERPAEPGRLLTLAAPHLRPSDVGRNPDLRAGKECPECDVDAVPLPGDRGPVRHEPIVGAPRYTVGIGMEGAAKGAWDPVPNHQLVPVCRRHALQNTGTGRDADEPALRWIVQVPIGFSGSAGRELGCPLAHPG